MNNSELLKLDSIIQSLTLSNYSTDFVFATENNSVHLWNPGHKQMAHVRIPNSSENQKSMMSTCPSSHPLIYHLSKEKELYSIDFRNPTVESIYSCSTPIQSIATIPNDPRSILLSTNSVLRLFDIRQFNIPQLELQLPSSSTGNIHIHSFEEEDHYRIF